ncbi:MAG TPA: ribonucleoside-diphosphate reductase subunit alpha, partial [Blastocatellia bacterium]|nr:ribonucleoside-diphosphate reductase subunit alpha [Blastocatellia bacterium]
MRVRKRNGTLEPVDVNKIVRAVGRCCTELQAVDSIRVATKTIGGLFDTATTKELDRLSINTAASLIVEEPEYSRLAARLLATYVDKEVRNQEIHSFSQSISVGHQAGLISAQIAEFVAAHSRKLNDAIEPDRSDLFEYFGLRTVYDRYLLRHPTRRDVLETPQYFFLRVACGLAQNVGDAIALYRLFSSLEYLPSTPTLFNSATNHQQLSSCFLLDSPQDELESIYRKYTEVALLSKFAGGIGVAYHRVRAKGSLIRGTNGHSNGIIPWLKTLDSSVAAVHQGGKRKGACCVYLESWHADVEEFLELRDNTGDEARRTYNLHLANWVPDLFMRRVEADQVWSLFDPKLVPQLPDLYGEEFERAYLEAEAQGLFAKQVKARDLYQRMMKTLAQTGNGWMTFKDASNRKCNQTAQPGTVVHLSNLCTEIIEVTSPAETAVCNLGSLNLSRYVTGGEFDFEKLARNVRLAMRALDRVIDINYYAVPTAVTSNQRWRPVGLGVMGLQDVFFQMGMPFDSPEALALSTRIQEEIYYQALLASCELAEESDPHPAFAETRAARGELQFDLWGIRPGSAGRWETLRERIRRSGLRNSLLIAVAPTATIASICGCYESIEPQVSNLFKRETISGD